jgi:hypothetical protein
VIAELVPPVAEPGILTLLTSVQIAGALITTTLPLVPLVGMFVVNVTVPVQAPLGVGTTMPVMEPPDTELIDVTLPDPLHDEFQE